MYCQRLQGVPEVPEVRGMTESFLPSATSFNKLVTLDLKEFGSKYVLWMVDIFTRFIQGKLITNKRVETIINAVNEGLCMSVGFPSVGFFEDNGGKFPT